MIDEEFTTHLLNKHSFLARIDSVDCLTLKCNSSDLVEFLYSLRDEESFAMLVDLTGIDHGDSSDVRFSVVMHLYSLVHHGYIRIHSDCADNESPKFPTTTSVYPAANWHERETFDMFGIEFLDHPNHKRILMWDDYPYFPLRKEFPLAGIETPLPAPDVSEVTDASVEPAPMMGGPFVSSADGTMSDTEPRAKDESWTEVNEKTL